MRVTASSTFRGKRGLGAAALVSAMALAATLLVTSPAAADDYPSWDDVVAAQANEGAKQSQIAEIQGLISGLQAQVDSAQAVAQKAWEADQVAQKALADGTAKAASLQSQADAAKIGSEESSKRAAGLAAQFARSAGNDLTSHLMVSGGDTEDLLYQLGTMSKLSETSQGVFDKAKQDANTASSLSRQAALAQSELEGLASAADASLQAARDAQKVVQGALLDQEEHQAELTVQLAALQQNTAQTVADFNTGQAVAAEKQRLQDEQDARARAEAAAAAAADDGDSGSGGGGGGGGSDSGNSGGGGSGGGGDINITPPAQSYSGDAVVAFAEQFVGVVPYGYGADPSDSFGCDGLTQYVYGQFGIRLPRLVSRQAAMGVQVSPQDALPGDLVVWPGAHIGIYDGHGGVIHSPDWGRYVTHNPGLWGSYYFVRLL
ncbi:NlpC/P60 family protein [Herbiconiux sp. CPCC 205763]|uniref:NlpC/P60 family protein n=1 Tax=Herbiconiux aconitum TaxID=2970913 RepID=A0ABT2GSV8_9MICO|nr:NlpC/P60 family protein [Herbiconiux aconitum]MCS5719275.1 NlpC/P60 family protein [Herbiconiux aconitum]